MRHRVALVTTDISEERIVFVIVVPTSFILVTLIMETILSSEMSVLIRATWRPIPENGILHSHRPGNLTSYMKFLLIVFTNLETRR
jgi:hypothetical protein